MFVEVPISVVVPPKMLAKESGISSLDGAMSSVRARLITTGVRITTTGVLLMKAERKVAPLIMVTSDSNSRPPPALAANRPRGRSEEHTSELQSLMRISYAVFCLKKKNEVIQSHRSDKPHGVEH